MELKPPTFTKFVYRGRLLIVLNGIETQMMEEQMRYNTLLIVLNGIETRMEQYFFSKHVTFNRTKWN